MRDLVVDERVGKNLEIIIFNVGSTLYREEARAFVRANKETK